MTTFLKPHIVFSSRKTSEGESATFSAEKTRTRDPRATRGSFTRQY